MRTADMLSKQFAKADKAAWESLTPREQELCRRSTRGLTKAAIAAEMGISRDAVRKLQKLIRKKIAWRANVYFGSNH